MPETVSSTVEHIRTELRKVIVGQDDAIEQILIALLAEGHALVEGVPGTAKTLTVKTLSRIINASFSRIQFTPDLMPSDITGTNVFNIATSNFNLRRGPIFTDILLADEINRTPPKTQAALLEAMEERQVTIDGDAYPLPPIFTVLATENPIEYEGTYPLPEAQLDRFQLKILLDYPERRSRARSGSALECRVQFKAVGAGRHTTTSRSGGHSSLPRGGCASADGTRRATLRCGSGSAHTRASVHSLRCQPARIGGALLCSKALAAIRGRDFVTPDDVRDVALAGSAASFDVACGS